MTTADPLSLAQAQRLAANADTILLRATRPADLETPIGAFLRLDDGGPAYLLESVEGGERLGRYSLPRRRAAAAARGPRRRSPGSRPGPSTVDRLRPGPARSRRAEAADPLDAIRAFVPRRRVQPTEGMPRFTGGAVGALAYDAVSRLRADRPAPRPRPGRRPDGRLHRDRPRPRLRPPDPHAVGDRLAPHRGARPRGPLPDRRGGDLRGARADVAAERRRDGRPASRRSDGQRGARRRRTDARPSRSRRASAATSTSTPSRSPRTRSRPARRSRSCSPGASRSTCPTDPATGAPLDGIGLYRALRRVNPSPYLFFVRTPGVRGRRRVARSSSSRSRATG